MNQIVELPFAQVLEDEHPEAILERALPFMELMMHHKCAMRELETKLNVLNDEFSIFYNRNPIESIKTRLKSPMSIVQKLRRSGHALTLENMETKLSDIAGIRVICSFQEDIYHLADMLSRQDDISVVQVKDYIKNPKPNGYRSLHLIVETPIYLSTEKLYLRAEVQFRTIAMDFWASLDHKLKYKKDVPNADYIVDELRKCADAISDIDERMQQIRAMIDADETNSPA